MSEFRQDPLSGRWVIIGGERAGRPNEFVEAATRAKDIPCPFCPGHESQTPPPVAVYPPQATSGVAPAAAAETVCSGEPGLIGKFQSPGGISNSRRAATGSPASSAWAVRVVPNKYPAVCEPVHGLAKPDAGTGPGASAELFRSVPGYGRHEVIIESPRHVASVSELSPEEAALVFRVYRDRMLQIKAEQRFKYVQIFKNAGPAAGASLEHIHSQLVALHEIPEVVQQELASCEEYYRRHQRGLLATLLEGELEAQTRIVAQTEHIVAFCPYASRFAWEVWVLPRRPAACFEDSEDRELEEAAQVIRDLIGRIERAVGQAAYNYFLHTLPFDGAVTEHYHWHVELVPRLTKTAGFEWSTGCFINPVPPEWAAEQLRASGPAVRSLQAKQGRKPEGAR
jgi:UDPglucose--hexose-1-phosphate uridylyltransferase